MRIPLMAALVAAAAVVATVLPATAADTTAAAPPAPRRAAAEHVVLIDWDGFDPDYLGLVPTPNLDALAERGSLTVGTGTYQTVSNPVRASIATGATPDTHENAAYYFDQETETARGQERFLAVETIAEAMAEAGRSVAAVQWYIVQDHGTAYGDPEHLYVQPGGDFGARVDVAIDILHRRPIDSGGEQVTVPEVPDLLAVYAGELDVVGHGEGAESPNLGTRLTVRATFQLSEVRPMDFAV
jgi:predicted AlkP superfamily pyrophosphatase or phosphodiesterase